MADRTGSREQTRWLSADEQRAWRAFLEANRLLYDAVEVQLQRGADLPHNYYEILVRLSEAPGHSLRMTELAEASMSSKSRLSHAVARLEERGWVRRGECASDRRGQVAVLTPKGFAALEEIAPGHVECVRAALFDALSPAQVKQLRTISEAVVKQLQAGGAAD
jgi:DNA-binding MarR family transcriptional regulator